MPQNPFAGNLALNITVLRPDKLNYRVLFDMVQTFRKECGKFPDLIEFTPELLAVFKRDVAADGGKRDKFLGIPCVIDPRHATSYNLPGAKAGE